MLLLPVPAAWLPALTPPSRPSRFVIAASWRYSDQSAAARIRARSDLIALVAAVFGHKGLLIGHRGRQVAALLRFALRSEGRC